MGIEMRKQLTADEVGLLKEIVRWRLDGGLIEFAQAFPAYRGGKLAFAWLSPRSEATCMKIGITKDWPRGSFEWHKVSSVGQGVDLLVTLGMLPMRFSSAYRAGWEAAHEIALARESRRWAPLGAYEAVKPVAR